MRRILVLAGAAAPCLWAVTIEGIVRDRAGNGLADTVVEVYAMVEGQLAAIGKTVSGGARAGRPAGYYRVSVPSSGPIAAISYSHDAWQPRLVRDVSGLPGDNQVIHKVLLDRQGPVRFLPILEQIHQYEELYYLERDLAGPKADPEAVRQRVRRKYEDLILSMPDPGRLDQQSKKHRDIVAKMSDEEKRLLQRKMADLLRLYGIPDVAHSRWRTVYSSAGGEHVAALVTLRGRSGEYRLAVPSGQVAAGRLSGVEIARDGLKFTIAGRWELGTASGYFRWASKPGAPDAFEGEWGYDPRRGPEGPWIGELLPDR